MRILTFADHYLPGFKAGGPIRTISAMVSQLPKELEFLIVTLDRDFRDRQRYQGIAINKWTNVGAARVLYLRWFDFNIPNLVRLIRKVKPDVVYANSFFSRVTRRLLALRRLGLMGGLPMVLAPRGEFSRGALGIKAGRKRAYLIAGNMLGLFRDIRWQASTELERADIISALGEGQRSGLFANILVARDLFDHQTEFPSEVAVKHVGAARFVFLSRISRKKNVHSAIRFVGALDGEATFDIFGPIEDHEYWRECQSAIAAARPNVKITWRGNVSPKDVLKTFGDYHFFVFPTLGENFGHVIMESLSAGCPVLLSDQTPWCNIEADGAGWILPLDQRQRWTDVLQGCIALDDSTYRAMRQRTLIAARRYDDRRSAVRQNVSLFEEASSRGIKRPIEGG